MQDIRLISQRNVNSSWQKHKKPVPTVTKTAGDVCQNQLLTDVPALRTGSSSRLLCMFHRIQYFAFLVNHMKIQFFLVGSDQRKTGFSTTELSTVNRLDLTAQ